MTEEESVAIVEDLREAIVPPAGYTYQMTGYGPITLDSAEQSEKDLLRAETVSFPILLLVLILVFASAVAAGMPLLVAGLAIPSSLALIYVVAQQVEMSIFVLNIATMLGLALAIDYSLFIVSRFREELARGRTVPDAVERTVATSGKAVAFSGIAVAVGLSGLLVFEAPAIRSIGISGSIVVLCSVLYGLTFLPAVLGMLGHRVNSLSLRRFGRFRPAAADPAAAPARTSRWERVAHAVMRRPVAVLVPTLARPAHRRQPVPAPRAGCAGCRDLSGRRREPRRLRRAPDRIRSGRDHADRHPRRRHGRTDVPDERGGGHGPRERRRRPRRHRSGGGTVHHPRPPDRRAS